MRFGEKSFDFSKDELFFIREVSNIQMSTHEIYPSSIVSLGYIGRKFNYEYNYLLAL